MSLASLPHRLLTKPLELAIKDVSTPDLAIPFVLNMNFPKTFSHSSQLLLERTLWSSPRNHFQVLLSSSSQDLLIDSLSSSVCPIPLCLLLCFFSVSSDLIDKHCLSYHCINEMIQCNYNNDIIIMKL